jgi:hypothetical protein
LTEIYYFIAISPEQEKSIKKRRRKVLFTKKLSTGTGKVLFASSAADIESYQNQILKGQCNEIFDPRFFSSINPPPPGPDSQAKAVSHMASNWP